MKKYLFIIILLPIISFSQEMIIEEGFTSFEILPSGIRTLNGTGAINSNVTLGSRSFYPFTSSSVDNVQFGTGNMSNGVVGNGNIAIGKAVFGNLNKGDYNIGIGNETLLRLHQDDFNIGVGNSNGRLLIEGERNLLLGSNNLQTTDQSDDNILIGTLLMSSVSNAGSKNLAIGFQNLQSSSGSENISLGFGSLFDNTTGSSNIAIGNSTLFNNTSGSSNIHLGSTSGLNNSTGSYNIALGSQSLNNNIEGSHNIAIGSKSLESSPASNCIAIGREAAANVNNTAPRSISIGSLSNQDLTTGKDNLSLGFWANRHNETGTRNVSSGSYSLHANTASDNIGLGQRAGDAHITGSNNIFVGSFSDDNSASKNISNSAAIGYATTVTSNHTYVLGNASVGSIGGYAGWTNYSDRRLKENIVYTNTLGLDFINDLKTAKYSYKADETERVLDGLIAQDVKASLEKLGLQWSGLVELDDENNTLTIAYNQLTIPLINATQELKTKLDKVKDMIADLQAENLALLTLNKQYDEFIAKNNAQKTSK